MRRVLTLALALSAFAALLAAPAPAQAQRIDETPRIAIVSAFAPELEALREGLEISAEHEANGVRFLLGTLEGRDVVVFVSGVSMVNAAMTTQLVLERFEVSALVVSGIAGGIDPQYALGDVVVPERWGPYLHMVAARESGEGFDVPPFYEKKFANFGMFFPQPVEVRRPDGGGVEERFWFEADPKLLEAARRAAQNPGLASCARDGACLPGTPAMKVGGSAVSGSAFVDNAAFRDWILATFEASIVDMESSAVAQVAYANDVPFIALRSVSDLAGGTEGQNEMETFMALAAGNSAAAVRALLRALAR